MSFAANSSSGAFPYQPSNFVPAPLAAPVDIFLDCGTATFDSDTLQFGNWCGTNLPIVTMVSSSTGPTAVALSMGNLTVTGEDTGAHSATGHKSAHDCQHR